MLQPFLGLAREISALFVPVRMRPSFRADLEESLMIAARHPSLRGSLTLEPDFDPRTYDGRFGRRWVVGAAVGSAVSIASIASIASIVAIVWRYRSKAA